MFEYKDNLLVVDELYFDPRYPINPVVKIRDGYYMLPAGYVTAKRISEGELKPFKDKPGTRARKAMQSFEYLMCRLIPREGFKVNVGRAITEEELEGLKQEYGLTDDDISKEFDDEKGAIYGDDTKQTYKAIQIRVLANEAIALEEKLRERGIEASSGSPGRVNIRTGWGGRREGAGRPVTGRKKKTFYVTDEEYEKLKEYLQTLR